MVFPLFSGWPEMHPPDKKLNYSFLNDVALDLLPPPPKTKLA